MPRFRPDYICALLMALLFADVAGAGTYRSFSTDAASYTPPPRDRYDGSIVVKFHNGSDVQALQDRTQFFQSSVGGNAVDLARLRASLAKSGALMPSAEFTRPTTELRTERTMAEQNAGGELPDLALFFILRVPDYQGAIALLGELRTNALVETAYARTLPVAPPTADLTANQTYLRSSAATNGYDVLYAWSKPGGNGSSAKLIDIEYQWTFNHEDLRKSATNILWGTMYTNFGPDHGTAALGISAAVSNGFGMNGIVHKANIQMVASTDANSSWLLANAINQAVAFTSPGDVILLEQQDYNSTFSGYCPVEDLADVYSAIANATALGRTIIEPAGNGNLDLDAAGWGGIFQRSTRDSGAIMIGAGTASGRSRCSFSCYGSRVDIQGWGDWSVATLAYGDLSGSTATNKYTATFSGTSSASALSAGVAAAVQSYAKANYGFYLPPLMLRSNLVQSGYAQTFGLAGNIGPLPNLSNAFANVDALAADPDGDGVPTWQEILAGTNPNSATSCLRIASATVSRSGWGIVVQWQSVTNRLYTLERSTNLLVASPFTAITNHIPGQAGSTICTDSTASASGVYLYRARVEQ